MTADWDAVLVEMGRLLAFARSGDDQAVDALDKMFADHADAFLSAALRERESAKEVERLREALRSIAANTCCDRCQEAALVARAAEKGERT